MQFNAVLKQKAVSSSLHEDYRKMASLLPRFSGEVSAAGLKIGAGALVHREDALEGKGW